MPIEALIAACREAGEAALSMRGLPARQKHDGSPVTPADIRSQEILLAALAVTGLPVVSEERLPIPEHASGKAWIIDPLDGTASFLKNDPNWAVMVALIDTGSPRMGIVYAPELDALWYAERGAGAFLESGGTKRPMRVSTIADARAASILLSANHPSPEAQSVAQRLDAKVTRTSGTGIKACRIAEGIADMYWSEANLGEWDACAPHIIVEEAGGRFSDARGKDILYGSVAERPVHGLAVSNGHLHDLLAAAGTLVLDGRN